MPAKNDKVSAVLRQMADLLELEGANSYRIKAYRHAAQCIASLEQDAAQLIKQDESVLRRLGIKDQMVDKIRQIIVTGSLPDMLELEKRLPDIFVELLALPGLHPEHVSRLCLELNITSLADLKAALHNGTVHRLYGFDEKLVDRLKTSLN